MPNTTKRIGKLSFKDLPSSYEALCRLYLPRPIHSQAACAEARELIHALAGYDLSRDQADYLDAIATFVHEYEQRRIELPPIEPVEILRHLVEENGLSGKDLAEILAVDKSLAARILKGTRSITAAHARRLGERFKVRPALFLGIK